MPTGALCRILHGTLVSFFFCFIPHEPQTAPRCNPKCSCGLCGFLCYVVNGLQYHTPNPYKIAFSSFTIVLVPPYSVFCSISFRCGGLSIGRNQKPLTPENTLAITHHDKQKQVEVKRSSRANPHEIRLFSGCPYYFTLPMYCDHDPFTKQLWQP